MNILTPCHAMPLLVLTTTEGYGHLTQDVPDEILCVAPGCHNSWNAKGEASPYNVKP